MKDLQFEEVHQKDGGPGMMNLYIWIEILFFDWFNIP
jgi:hypothetical protein